MFTILIIKHLPLVSLKSASLGESCEVFISFFLTKSLFSILTLSLTGRIDGSFRFK